MRPIDNPPLQQKLWKAIFLPVLAIIASAAIIIYLSEIFDRKKQFEYLSRYQTEQVADSSEYALLFNDQNLIASNIHGLLRQQDIIGVTYFNNQRQIIDKVGQVTPPQTDLPTQITSRYANNGNHYVSIAPIFYLNTTQENMGDIPFNQANPTLIADSIGLTKTPQRELLGWIQVTASTQRIQLEQISFGLSIFGYFMAAVIASAFLCWKYAVRLSVPWLRITRTLTDITSGDYDSSNTLSLPKHLQKTQEELKYISERLKNYRSDLETEIDQITKETRENSILLEEKSAQLHIANKEAMESNRLKTQFLANISHEVRTPLSAILGYTNLLQKDRLEEQQKDYVETIAQSTNDLLTTIGNILDFSKIEAGKTVVLDSEDFNLRESIDDVLHSLASTPSTEAKDIDLVPSFDPNLPDWVKGDKTRLRQILNNLVGNAIKFTQKGSIQVIVDGKQVSNEELDISIEVVDTGCGIPSEKINQLFKPFSQVDSSHTRSYAGTGLGLVITKKLIEQMSGDIGVISEQGRGSNFYFTIRLKASKKTTEPLAPLEHHLLILEPSNNYRAYLSSCLDAFSSSYIFTSSTEQFINALHDSGKPYTATLICAGSDQETAEEIHELVQYLNQRFQLPSLILAKPTSYITLHTQHYQHLSAIVQKPLSASKLHYALTHLSTQNGPSETIEANAKAIEPPVYERLNGLHVLAVDDTQINLQLLGHWLDPHGIKLSLAHSGQQALTMAQTQSFDLILMDIQMPEMDGMETTKRLRQIDDYKDTPIIALTAHALAQEQQSILASGMNAYLTKPINEETLLNTLQDWCYSNKNLSVQVEEELSEVFDLHKALSMTGNRAQAAKDLFEMLMQSLIEDKRLLSHHFEQRDLDKLIATVHRIHGASKYSGTIELTKHANFLETHLKELGFDEAEDVYNDFINALERLEYAQSLIPWPLASQRQVQTASHPIS